MSLLTVGVSMAWQIAAGVAVSLKSRYIEKEHVFIGLLSLDKLIGMGEKHVGLSTRSWLSLINEYRLLEHVMDKYRLSHTQLRRRVREQLETGDHHHEDSIIHRSEECIAVFKEAETMAKASGRGHFSSLHLFAAMLKSPGDEIGVPLREAGCIPQLISLYVQNLAGRRRLSVTRLTTGELETVFSFLQSRDSSKLVVLFDDIVVAPELGSALTDYSYSVLLKRHEELVRDLVGLGREAVIVKSTGNGLLLVFDSVPTAVRAALAIQKSYRTIRSNQVRMGISAGSAGDLEQTKQEQRPNNPVEAAYALMRLSAGGHVLTDERVREEVRSLESPALACHCFGHVSLKTMAGDCSVCEIYDPGPMMRLPGLPEDEKISDMRDVIDDAMISRVSSTDPG